MKLGIWNVEGWLEQISWSQFRYWLAYYELEPFGEERGDLRAGIIASTIANVHRDPKKGKAFRPDDFTPKFGRERKGGIGTGSTGSTGRRRPLTDPNEWQKVMRMAKTLNQGRVRE